MNRETPIFRSEKLNALIQTYRVSILLGEVSSGKSYLLKDYYERNKETTQFVELITLAEDDTIDTSIKVVLLDAMDEVLYHNPSHKLLKSRLSKYISKCRTINQNVKFVITCRGSVWDSSYNNFLKDIDPKYHDLQNKIHTLSAFTKRKLLLFARTPEDKELQQTYKDVSIKEYSIEPLTEEDINNYLGDNKKINDFWQFTKQNYLTHTYYNKENPLAIHNMPITLALIDNAKDYKKLSYHEVYQKLIEQHLEVSTDNERCQQLDNISIDEMLSIASSVAFYMIKDNIRSFPIKENRAEFIYNLAQSINKEISIEKLNIVFDTALFYGGEPKLFDEELHHVIILQRSISRTHIFNYLCAYYLKSLSTEEIKSLTIHDLGVVDKFIKPLVHLSNIRLELFDIYVDINPFIFTQHTQLDAIQQAKLLISIIDKIQEDNGLFENIEQYFIGTLLRFDILDDMKIKSILAETINVQSINKELYLYLLDFIPLDYIGILWEQVKENKNFREIVQYVHYEDREYNQKLFTFMKENRLFEKESYDNMIAKYNYKGSFEFNLFKELYKINIGFDDLIYLLEYIPDDELKDIVSILTKEELEQWFTYLEENYTREKYNRIYISWCIYGLFMNYQSIDTSVRVIKFLEKYAISIEYQKEKSRPYNLPNYGMKNENKILNDILEIYFLNTNTNINIKHIDTLSMLLSFYKADIASLPKLYPIEKYEEKYKELRERFFKLNWAFLFEYEAFRENKKEIEKKVSLKEYLDKYKRIIKFMTKFDYAITLCLANNRKYLKKTTKKLLEDYYSEFMDELKENFRKHTVDIIGIEKNTEGLGKGQYFINYLVKEYKAYIPLFNTLSQDEVLSIVDNEEMYKKFFWLWVMAIPTVITNNSYLNSCKLYEIYPVSFISLVIEYTTL